LGHARDALAAVDGELRGAQQQRHQAEQAVEAAAEARQQAQLRMQEIQTMVAGLLEQAGEHSLTPADLDRLMDDSLDEAAIRESLAQLERRIARLGAINLAAIDERTQVAERKAYLDRQHEDLTEALATMETTIQKIDRETRSRFKETFDKVQAGMQASFPRLFGGGHASLALTGDDLLSAGVEVEARPPGKRNASIHQLSGGEKSLTAIALIFSIFELNPAPFCILDEVDAPLDDANVSRYCDLVREMSSRVQFVIITHNKTTMALSQQLTGVTMSEPGVSRLVAVDLDDAVELASA
jgi:chromosome segregation protein